jgi:BirA family transcriptional regulator, biotin operon repressor / biotin---[acetyl-CoA-carboxylase] ligase
VPGSLGGVPRSGINGHLPPDPNQIDEAWLAATVLRPGSLWRQIDVVARTGSTNADLSARARAGEAPGVVLVTGDQTAGRGRQGRHWTAPPGGSVALSLLVAPHDIAPERWGWLSLLAGLAVVEGVRRIADLQTTLKWPNDVLVGDRKLCGILAERVDTAHGPACVVGIGINVGMAADQLPVPTATSLALELGDDAPSPSRVVAAVLAAFELLFTEWERRDDDSAFAAAYVARSATVGRRVRVTVPGGGVAEGIAEAVDADGRLVVRTAAGTQAFSAGDVSHLR